MKLTTAAVAVVETTAERKGSISTASFTTRGVGGSGSGAFVGADRPSVDGAADESLTTMGSAPEEGGSLPSLADEVKATTDLLRSVEALLPMSLVEEARREVREEQRATATGGEDD